MKKGFTLIELLGVIVLLGVLSLLIVPVVNNMMIESREKLAESQEKTILKAAKNWGHSHIFMLPDCEGASACDDTITITLGQIMNEGFLDNQTIKDVNKNKIYSPATEIVIGKYNNQNTYTLAENAYEDEIISEEGGPTIVLNGSSATIEEANRDGSANYVEPGVIVKDKNGTNIAYNVTVSKISEEGKTITPISLVNTNKSAGASGYSLGFNTQKVANYKIVYTATADGKEAKMVRNVQVRDTTAPTISFINNIEVASSMAHLYSNEATLFSHITFIAPGTSSSEANTQRNEALKRISGVVIMDNSCGYSNNASQTGLEISIESSVPSPAKLGTYSVKYTVEDKYGNKFKKIRNIKIIEG